jgi:transposase
MGRETIRQYFQVFGEGGVLDGSPDELPEQSALEDLVSNSLDPKTPPQQTSTIERWRPQVEVLLKRAGRARPTSIHDYLRLHEPEYEGSLSAMKRLCVRIVQDQGPSATDVAIPVDTAPGEVAQVDFGYVGMCHDPERGVSRKAWIFVMTLGHSRYTFAEIVFDQTIATWLALHIQAFEFLDGVPRVIVPDNLKSAVIRAAFGVDDDASLNRSYRELARYYGFQIDPAPPRAPKKKGKVERDVRYIKESFFATWESVDIDEDRRQLRRWLLEIAAKRRHGTTGRIPEESFKEEEKAALIVLPARRWESVVWKNVTLHRNSHIQVDASFYSAPWRFLGEKLWARCTRHSILIYRGSKYLCAHARVPTGKKSTVEAHLPEHRRELRHRNPEHWMDRAKAVGPAVERLAKAIFESDDVLLQLRRVQAVVTHLESVPAERACRAAARALHFGCLEYQAIKNILSKGLDLEALPGERARNWAQDSRFARKPNNIPSSKKERHHGSF